MCAHGGFVLTVACQICHSLATLTHAHSQTLSLVDSSVIVIVIQFQIRLISDSSFPTQINYSSTLTDFHPRHCTTLLPCFALPCTAPSSLPLFTHSESDEGSLHAHLYLYGVIICCIHTPATNTKTPSPNTDTTVAYEVQSEQKPIATRRIIPLHSTTNTIISSINNRP